MLTVTNGLQRCLSVGLLWLAVPMAAACGGSDEAVGSPYPPPEEGSSEAEALFEPSAVVTSHLPDATRIAERRAATQNLAAQLVEARGQWASVDPQDYTVKARRSCFCAPLAEDDVSVVVREGAVVAAFSKGDSGEYDLPVPAERLRDWYTVPGMFGKIEYYLTTADRISVVYDPALGFPTTLLFDHQAISSEDGEFFEMREFALLAE